VDGGILGTIVLIIINIVVVAFGGGRLYQKVSDLCRRIERLEKIVNGKNPGKREDQCDTP
jgi:hypothetical protein